MFKKLYAKKIIMAISLSVATMMVSGCAIKPLLPPMNPVKLDSKSVSNMSKEEVQSLLSKTMNQRVAAAGGSEYLKDPKHLAISTTDTSEGSHDGRYVLWEKYSYSYAYGYYYDSEKKEIIEVPVNVCIDSYLSGTSGQIHVYNHECDSSNSRANPGEDFKYKIRAFRAYLATEFPNFIADYNSNKIK